MLWVPVLSAFVCFGIYLSFGGWICVYVSLLFEFMYSYGILYVFCIVCGCVFL